MILRGSRPKSLWNREGISALSERAVSTVQAILGVSREEAQEAIILMMGASALARSGATAEETDAAMAALVKRMEGTS